MILNDTSDDFIVLSLFEKTIRLRSDFGRRTNEWPKTKTVEGAMLPK